MLPPLLHHREQAHLFLEHVLLKRAPDRAQFVAQALVDAARIDRLREAQQFWQSAAAAFMRSRLVVVDQRGGLLGISREAERRWG